MLSPRKVTTDPLAQVDALNAAMDASSEAMYASGPHSQESNKAHRIATAQMMALVADITAMEANNE